MSGSIRRLDSKDGAILTDGLGVCSYFNKWMEILIDKTQRSICKKRCFLKKDTLCQGQIGLPMLL